MNEPDGNLENRIALFQKREIRRTLHNNEWWFVITDVIAALTDSTDPSDDWKKMRKRDPDLGKALQGGGQTVPPLALEFATAGGLQKIQCWNIEGIFRLIQSIPSPKAEPFKRWLARVGKERIEAKKGRGLIMPELDAITVKGFKSIAAIENLKLNAVNVVVGPNGAGKSNFLGVFSFLHAIREGHLQNYVMKAGGAEKILHFGSKTTAQVQIHLSFRGGHNQYEINLQPTAADELVPLSESVCFWDKQRYPAGPFEEALSPVKKEAGISVARQSKTVDYIRRHFDRWRLYHFHDTSFSSPMKKTADIDDNHYLRSDGSNLAAFLYLLSEKHESSYSLIRRTVQLVAPFFDDFRLEPQRLNPDKIRLEWRHKDSEAYFDASSLSDGTLRFIALSTLFLQPENYRPSVILVDEPELGLHPYGIAMLASLVKQASTTTQAIVSTQSPLLLDHFRPEDVLVADRINGSTQFTRPDPEKLTRWLEDYSLGQLWEKNELGGRPGAE